MLKVAPFIYEVINSRQVRFTHLGHSRKRKKAKKIAKDQGYRYYRIQYINGYYHVYARKTSPYKRFNI